MTKRQQVLSVLNEAMRDGKNMTIRFDAEHGSVIVMLNREVKVRWKDQYEAIDDLFPEYKVRHEAA